MQKRWKTAKGKIQQSVRDAVRRGILKKPNKCEKCQLIIPRKILFGHHYKGYDFPLEVKWLCGKCHSEEHNQKHFGEENGNSKTNWKTIKFIRSNQNLRVVELVNITGIKKSQIYNIINFKNWRENGIPSVQSNGNMSPN